MGRISMTGWLREGSSHSSLSSGTGRRHGVTWLRRGCIYRSSFRGLARAALLGLGAAMRDCPSMSDWHGSPFGDGFYKGRAQLILTTARRGHPGLPCLVNGPLSLSSVSASGREEGVRFPGPGRRRKWKERRVTREGRDNTGLPGLGVALLS